MKHCRATETDRNDPDRNDHDLNVPDPNDRDRNVPDPNDRDRNVPDPNDRDQNDLNQLLCQAYFSLTYPHSPSHTECGVGHFVSQL